MSKSKYGMGLVLLAWLLCIGAANGQQTTEIYIPIGNSPGVSGNKSLIGVIRSVDYESHSIEIQLTTGLRTVRVDDTTRYSLDRSRKQRKNSLGTLENCAEGQTIEVRISADGAVDWIKIETET